MKQLSSFMILNVDGGDRVTYTYNEIDDELKGHIDAIRDFIKDNKLND